ncbi:MAG TPA: 50S ribosomal protein L11 methyltransferase [Desulfobacterales bacterium]|nr:50S ribosomal protein L11 methyltransferase [Desulfobacterales bacterium]
MKWIEAKVIFNSDDNLLAMDLISNIFYDFGLKGVVIEQPDIEPLEGWGEDALIIPNHYSVTGYIPKNEPATCRSKTLEKELERLEKENILHCRVDYKEVDEQDWSETWKAYFQPEKIGKKIVVKPTWNKYDPGPGQIVLEIDPGMAFGTGTHPTTAACINLIEKYLMPGDSLLDVGTGSGILLIAAAKLGAGKVCGVDNDPIAVEIAAKNLRLNKIETKKIQVIAGNLVEKIQGRFHLVVANILSEVILVLLDQIKRVLKENGIFIGSGIVENNKWRVIEKMQEFGFEILEIQTEANWVSIAGKLKSRHDPQ